MSHYGRTPALQIKSAAECAAALAHMGYTIEVHAEAQTLYDYHGRRRPEVAHVIVRRQYTGLGASNDVGFYFGPNGCEAIISDYDASKFNAAWLHGFTRECGVQRAILRANRMGHTVKRTTDERGRPRLAVMGRW